MAPNRMAALLTLALACAHVHAYTVVVDWSSAPVRKLNTITTLQVVVNPLLMRDSAVSSNLFAALSALGARANIRYVPWLPYPRLAVAELEPPSGSALCGLRQGSNSAGTTPVQLSCAAHGVIAGVDFAAYGSWGGSCGNLTVTGCVANTSASAVEAACVGQVSCSIPSTDAFFGGGGGCTGAGLAVQVHCSDPKAQHTYWDFAQLDDIMADFMDATAGSTVVINFSTPPQWLYETSKRVPYPDDPHVIELNYMQGRTLVDPTLTDFGNYYGRLLAWYTDGGFTDEYGVYHYSGHYYNISVWEVLNEMDHGMSPQGYVQHFDAVVTAMRAMAPRGAANLQFMGVATAEFQPSYYSYFLNVSNHAVGGGPVPLDWVSWHHYAHTNNRSDPTAYEHFFTSVDDITAAVLESIAIRDALSPSTRIDLDELGVILPDDNDPKWTGDAPGFPDVFWNAAGAMFAYEFASWSLLGVEALGCSQFVGYPTLQNVSVPAGFLDPQYPSVSMTNWTTGEGNARYWVLKLLLDSFDLGDAMLSTGVANSTSSAGAFCGTVLNGFNMSLTCTTPGAYISAIQFASFGTPTGTCGAYATGACNAANSTAVVEGLCLGASTCNIAAVPALFGDPCFGTAKNLTVQATCSAGGGYASGAEGVAAQAFVRARDGARLLLLINKLSSASTVTIASLNGGTFLYVDETTGFGPYASVPVTPNTWTWTLNRFAAGVVVMP